MPLDEHIFLIFISSMVEFLVLWESYRFVNLFFPELKFQQQFLQKGIFAYCWRLVGVEIWNERTRNATPIDNPLVASNIRPVFAFEGSRSYVPDAKHYTELHCTFYYLQTVTTDLD